MKIAKIKTLQVLNIIGKQLTSLCTLVVSVQELNELDYQVENVTIAGLLDIRLSAIYSLYIGSRLLCFRDSMKFNHNKAKAKSSSTFYERRGFFPNYIKGRCITRTVNCISQYTWGATNYVSADAIPTPWVYVGVHGSTAIAYLRVIVMELVRGGNI